MKNKPFARIVLISCVIGSLFISGFACTTKASPTPTEQSQPPATPTTQFLAMPAENASKPDLSAMLRQVQIDGSNFSKLLDDLSASVSTIKDPCSIDFKTIFPDDWMFEIYTDKASGSTKYALAMPIPPDIKRGFQQGKTADRITSYTFGDYLNPFTDIYISPTWNGQPYNWTGWIGISPDIAKYPVPVSHEYLATQKMCRQPYFIPDEATFGVYTENWTAKSCTPNSLSRLVYDLVQSNPYKDEQYSSSSVIAKLDSLSIEVNRLKDDDLLYSKMVDGFNNVYFKPNASIYNKGLALQKYKNDMSTIGDQLTKITSDYVNKIKTWDFSNLDKYSELKNK